jgi:SAM-dependent methyltransferase
MAEHAELEGEVLLGMTSEAVSLLADLCERQGLPVRRILDLGSGPGVGTCCLAERFTDAAVVAVDGSPTMLQRAEARAGRLGLGERIETALTQLPDGLGTLGRADVVWASMVLHHVGDETAALRGLRSLLEPRGLLALVETGDPLRVLPDGTDLGRSGIWERLGTAWAAWFGDMRAGLPGATESDAYPDMLRAAGFEVVIDQVLTLVLDPPDARARRFAHRHLARTQTQLAEYADPADLAALGMLIDEQADDGILRRPDARLAASRQFYVARAAA